MKQIGQLLLPTGLGVLIVLLGSITGIMDAGFEAAREGPVALVGFLEGFILLFVLVMLMLGIFASIRAAAQ
jgi:predicted Rossmann-fold nucleotide-binding protein